MSKPRKPPSQRNPKPVHLPSLEDLEAMIPKIDDAEFCVLLSRFASRLEDTILQVALMFRSARRRLELR